MIKSLNFFLEYEIWLFDRCCFILSQFHFWSTRKRQCWPVFFLRFYFISLNLEEPRISFDMPTSLIRGSSPLRSSDGSSCNMPNNSQNSVVFFVEFHNVYTCTQRPSSLIRSPPKGCYRCSQNDYHLWSPIWKYLTDDYSVLPRDIVRSHLSDENQKHAVSTRENR